MQEMKVPCCSPPRIKAEWADNRQQSLNHHCSDDEDDDEFDEVDEENGSGDSAVITYKDLFRMATLGGATGTNYWTRRYASVPIQLAQCRFPRLAVCSANNL